MFFSYLVFEKTTLLKRLCRGKTSPTRSVKKEKDKEIYIFFGSLQPQIIIAVCTPKYQIRKTRKNSDCVHVLECVSVHVLE